MAELPLQDFKKQLFHRNRLAEENRERENQAATRIQSWFRACKVRAYLSHLHKKAVIIQKIWRGFTARVHFRQMVKAAYFIMKMNFYEEMAVRIQRRWRGFYVRKYVHNFYARQIYLERLALRNKLVRKELDEFENIKKKERDCLERVKEQTAKVYEAHRLHHLISTKQIPGVFNSPFRPVPHEMELVLRQVKYKPPTRLTPRARTGLLSTPIPAVLSLPGSPGSPWIRDSCSTTRPKLPPIGMKNHKGSFGDPGDIWEQGLDYPELSLCLQNSYTRLEEVRRELRQREEGGCFSSCAKVEIPMMSMPIVKSSDCSAALSSEVH